MKLLLAMLLSLAASVSALAQESVYVEAVRCVGGPFGMKLPADARKLRLMAPLLREAIAEVERWDGYTATRKTLYFEGLEIGVVEFSNDAAKLMVTHADIASPKWNHLLPFKIHQSISSARAVLGASATDDARLSRSYDSDGDSLQFRTSGALLVGISYSCYSG
ncbi:hypothetical protein [Paucibacter sp. Y2R2-4]|uniref:hypothetical protein n=1 Tax=Paucibacter sp. Y2R2-4 TaxID=2893553 RepID=UPI0021E365BD|nr:hypothetical protein [Paucibacter sp. Y2R2-4]MCV2351200.1 hypothetical protein [Paucibacter sp. Y2R2-4]